MRMYASRPWKKNQVFVQQLLFYYLILNCFLFYAFQVNEQFKCFHLSIRIRSISLIKQIRETGVKELIR